MNAIRAFMIVMVALSVGSFLGAMVHAARGASTIVLSLQEEASVTSFCNSAELVMEVIEAQEEGGAWGSNMMLQKYLKSGDCYLLPPGHAIVFKPKKLIKEYPRYGVFILAGITDKEDEMIFAAVTTEWIDMHSKPSVKS